MLTVCEIFKSIQGESGFAGQICSFVRLSGCNLQCLWCDTPYARTEKGHLLSTDSIIKQVAQHGLSLVEITGGEPLLQKETPSLCERFIDNGYTVLIETNGSLDIGSLHKDVHRIVDIKCPGSGMNDQIYAPNIDKLESRDECKFVISDLRDARWAIDFVRKYELDKRCAVYFSPVAGQISIQELAEFILQNSSRIRLGLQLHKLIWNDRRGV